MKHIKLYEDLHSDMQDLSLSKSPEGWIFYADQSLSGPPGYSEPYGGWTWAIGMGKKSAMFAYAESTSAVSHLDTVANFLKAHDELTWSGFLNFMSEHISIGFDNLLVWNVEVKDKKNFKRRSGTIHAAKLGLIEKTFSEHFIDALDRIKKNESGDNE